MSNDYSPEHSQAPTDPSQNKLSFDDGTRMVLLRIPLTSLGIQRIIQGSPSITSYARGRVRKINEDLERLGLQPEVSGGELVIRYTFNIQQPAQRSLLDSWDPSGGSS